MPWVLRAWYPSHFFFSFSSSAFVYPLAYQFGGASTAWIQNACVFRLWAKLRALCCAKWKTVTLYCVINIASANCGSVNLVVACAERVSTNRTLARLLRSVQQWWHSNVAGHFSQYSCAIQNKNHESKQNKRNTWGSCINQPPWAVLKGKHN